MGRGSPKDLAKAHENVRSRKKCDGPRMPKGMKQVRDAQRNRMGRGSPR